MENQDCTPHNAGVDSQRLVSAAFRLKHDLGKAVRWSAPAERENDPAALARRRERDLLRTRRRNGVDESAIVVFDAWLAEEGPLFAGLARYEQALVGVREAIDAIRALPGGFSELGADELLRIDDLCLQVQEACHALWRDVVSTESGGGAP